MSRSRVIRLNSFEPCQNGVTKSALDLANCYVKLGWIPLPVPFRSKNPGFSGWQKFRVLEEDLPRYFNGQPQNIGVLLGAASGDLVDIDLDCDEAIALASHFLPKTSAIFGRETRPRSHWLYVTGVPRKVTFTDPSGGRLLEILTNGQQSIFPGSAHKETGEVVRWFENGQPASIPQTDLIQATQRLAVATLLARHWPKEGSRQDAALALAGGLLQTGWTEDETTHFIGCICRVARDEESDERIKATAYTKSKLENGAPVTGWPTLATTVGEEVVQTACKWLQMSTRKQPRTKLQLREGRSATDGSQRSDASEQIDKTTGPTITPSIWFAERFPSLSSEFGDPIHEQADKNGILSVRDIGEDFLAATLGDKGTPDAPTVFIPTEEKFYTYSAGEGIFIHEREAALQARLSRLLLDCARECKDDFDTRTLRFRFRDSSHLSGVLRKARGVLEVPHEFFSTELENFIPCANGMLRLPDRQLLPFHPSYRRRNKLAVPFEPAANCPLFLDTLMRPALDDDDLELLQRWCGLALVGVNLAQKILILTGTAGGGKGTFVRVLNGVIGATNLAALRPQLLLERFELGRFLGKTLLYGPDVPENFFNQRGASVLKSLTGADPVTLEFKNSNESPLIVCKYNVIVTCNSRLTVRLEGDTEAWRRRLAIVEYNKPKSTSLITDLDQRILTQEGPGVLNWMLQGLHKLQVDGWDMHLTSGQQNVVDNLLLESEGHILFIGEELERGDEQLTVEECFAAYVEYCNARGWKAISRNKFGHVVGDVVARRYGMTIRHDISDEKGKPQRGWRGLRCKTAS